MATQERPTTKVTLFLYTDTIELMRRRYGYGWSARIREVLDQWLKAAKTYEDRYKQAEEMWNKTHASPEE